MQKFIDASIIEKFPEYHFGSITQEVITNLLNGQCCGIYGTPGYGMNFFAKHIAFLIAKKYPKVKIILLNLELENDKVKVLEKELSKVLDEKQVNEINLAEYLQDHKIIVILGEVHHPRHRKLFKFLDALYSISRTNFTVLTVANYTLFKYTEKYLKNAPSIFTPLKKIPNFDLEGVKRIIKINNEEYNWNIPQKMARKILFLSGGNPALVKYICMALYEEGEKLLDRPKKLTKIQPLRHRLADIAALIPKLSIEEQIQLGILNNNGTIFSELLVEYLKENELDGLDKLFPDLTKTDRKILTLFIQNLEQIIDKDQLSLILDQTADTYSEWAIYKAVARVRDKIKDRYTIKTLKGRGWRMESIKS